MTSMARTHQTCQQQSVTETKAVTVQEVQLRQLEGTMPGPCSLLLDCWCLGQIILS